MVPSRARGAKAAQRNTKDPKQPEVNPRDLKGAWDSDIHKQRKPKEQAMHLQN